MPVSRPGEPGASTPPAADVARFRDDLAALTDIARNTVLVAVSGGGDSVALLLLTQAVLGGRCIAATVDHRLRAASADEAATVAGLCGRRGIVHATLTGALPDRIGGTANVSARARALRYRLLDEHATATGADWIATAHHADDQLETMVMRLNRGAGVAGLAGIRARSGRVVRPLLGWRRDELAAIAAGCGVEPIADPSNVDDRYDRARLRKMLAGVDWLDAARVGDSAQALAEAEEALAWAARRLWAERIAAEGAALLLDVEGLPAELVRRLVARCLATIEGGHEPAGPALTRLIATLAAGRPGMLGAVLARPIAPGVRWRFEPAPPRRSH